MNFLEKYFKFKKEMRMPFSKTEQINHQRHGFSTQNRDADLIKEYKNWVFACVNARAEEVASIELELYRGDSEIESHEVLDLLNDVNPNTTKYELFFGTQSFLDLTGNAFWYLARDNEGKGKIRQIYLISPDKLYIVPSKDNPLVIEGYVYANGKDKITFNPNEILHFKNFNPSGNYPNPHRGVGIVEASLWAIHTDNEARTWNYSFFKNSAKPDGLLTTEGILGDDQYERIKQQWRQTHEGSGNNGKTAIMEGGLKWQDVSKTQKDMDFVAQRTFSRDEILSMFRVPKTVVGITDDVNRANAEASDYVFAKRTIKPLMKAFVTILNEYLLPEYGNDLYFKFEDPTPEDRMAELQEYSLGWNKWLTTNDIRRDEGYDPSENGDTFYGSFSDVPRDTVNQTKKVKESKPISKGADKVIEDFMAKLPAKQKALKQVSPAQKSVYKEVYEKRFDKNEKSLMKDVIAFFKKQEIEVMNNVEDEFNGLKPKEYKLKGVEDALFDQKRAVGASISLITPHIRKFLNEGAEMADSLTGGDTNTDTPAFKKFLEERAKFFAETINETTRESLLKTINDALDNGEGVNDIKERVALVYKDAETYRTERIARTEVSASLNEGNIEAFKQAGIENVEWLAIVDDVTADICMQNDGEVRKLGQEFPSGETQPPNHVNCRCSVLPVFED